MKNTTFNSIVISHRLGRAGIAVTLLLGASHLSSLLAAPVFNCVGKDAATNITVNLSIEPLGTVASVTGAVYDGNPNCSATVSMGTLIGNGLSASMSYSLAGQPASSLLLGALTGTLTERIKLLAPEGVDHIVEVAFGANIGADVELLKMGGSIPAYATDNATPTIPFWQMVFKNIRLYCLGSDDFPTEAKVAATRDLNAALQAGWPGFEIEERVPLSEIAHGHELAEHPVRHGRIVVIV